MNAWYAIRVKSNHEKQVDASLAAKGLETFLPMCSSTSRWSDRLKRVELPLFAGYVFSRFDASRRLPVLSTPGVVHIVGDSTAPFPVDEAELDAIRHVMASGQPLTPWPFLKTGDVVIVERGPLSGSRGILLRIKDQFRLVVSLSLLHRSVAVELDRDAVTRESQAVTRKPPQLAHGATGF
jgi:transcription antitermination factor NusG